MEHELNGEHDCCTLQCLALGEEEDRWQVRMKDSNASGVLTIFHVLDDGEKAFNGWDWEGDPSLVNDDDTATNDLQNVLNCFDGWYT